MDTFILNIIHRPELVPEYIDTSAQEGKTEEVSKQEVVSESINIFRLQQEIAHRNNLKTTIQMTYSSLFNDECIDLVKQHHDEFGDEIGHTFLGLNCKEFREKFQSKELAIWLFPMDLKKEIVVDSFERFKEVFGFYPTSTGSYFMDAELIQFIKAEYPMVKAAIATCFEEGPKIFRHTNSSWYTLMDGSPWTAWIPSRQNSHAIADSEEDDIGIVAMPHLSRDLLAVMDNAGDMFGTHPQNIIRGLIYEDDRLPYMYNLIDQYRVLKRYNKGFSYNLVYVGPGWMGKGGRWEASYRILKKSYEDFLAYYGKLKEEDEVVDMTMTEFAAWFRENQPRSGPYCGLWKDVLWGTKNQAFWYVDSKFRVQVDLKQGGAITDLRPYTSKLTRPVGAGTEANQDASYPFIIQSRYRAGAFTHYAGEGAIKSCKVRYGSEEIDLSACRTTGGYREGEGCRILDIKPVEVEFNDLTIKLAGSYTFMENAGEIIIKRKIIESTDPKAEVEIDEYLTSCWGTTEYPEDLTGSLLSVTGNDNQREELRYAYRCRDQHMDDVKSVDAVIPQVQTKISLIPAQKGYHGYFVEGYSFAPNIKIGVSHAVTMSQEFEVCLKVDKA